MDKHISMPLNSYVHRQIITPVAAKVNVAYREIPVYCSCVPRSPEPVLRMTPILVLCLWTTALIVSAAPSPPRQTDEQLSVVLRSVTQAQAAYRASHGRYTSSLTELRVRPPAGVSVRLQAEGTAGFSAVASSGAGECAVYHGGVWAPRPWARTPGRIACRTRR